MKTIVDTWFPRFLARSYGFWVCLVYDRCLQFPFIVLMLV